MNVSSANSAPMPKPPLAEALSLPTITAKSSRELLVEHLRDGILSGRFGADSALPQERELVTQTGLSRGSVREALRILEAEGLISTRVGRNGGSTIARPSEALFKRQIYTFMQTRQVDLRQMIEVRETLEPRLASLAAMARTDEDIAAIQASLAAMEAAVGDAARFVHENGNWHLAVASASHNRMLRLFMEPVSDLVAEVSHLSTFGDVKLQEQVLRAHRGIGRAIVERDADAAARRMMRHVQTYPG